VLLVVVVACAWLGRRAGARPPAVATEAQRAPRLRPDYTELVIPPNIAPLNFVVAEPAARHVVRLADDQGRHLSLPARDGAVVFPARAWRALLAANLGRELHLDVWSRGSDGRWLHFAAVRHHVAPEPVDAWLAYRKFRPFYDSGGPLGLYQRDLRGFAERALVTAADLDVACVNCHTFADRRPETFIFQTRGGQHPPATVLVERGQARRVDPRPSGSGPPAGFASWHPNGQLVAFSRNRIYQFYPQAVRAKAALDVASSLAVHAVANGQTTVPAALNPPGRLPTFPCWSPDGRWLYFSSAPRLWPADTYLPVAHQKQLRYDVQRAAFDAATGAWGGLETVVAAGAVGGSALEPRVSPDGRWLVFCVCEAGSFPVFQERSDLWLLDLRTPGARPVALEPGGATRHDSWHSWSGNSRWLVCASKRDNELLARPYLRYLDADGHASKPFVVPRRDPRADQRDPCTYNVPEFVAGPVRVSRSALARTTRAKPSTPRPAEVQSGPPAEG
jgi:dipeptidyl aminopeptidase/acylaminoacyl peptidase